SGNTADRGGGIVNFQTMTITGCTISGNSAQYYGGGIWDPGNFGENNGILTITSSIVSGNTAGRNGGGIGGDAGLTLSGGSPIADNSASGDGGGIWMDGGTLTISNSAVARNTANGAGGGVYDYVSFASAISGCSINDNSAGVAGGGLYLAGVAGATVSGSTLAGNAVTRQVFYPWSGPFPIPGAAGGRSNGTALRVRGCPPTRTSPNGFDFGGSHYAGRGGGMFNVGEALRHPSVTTVRDSSFMGNSADLGGGIYNNDPGETLIVQGSTLSGNSATE